MMVAEHAVVRSVRSALEALHCADRTILLAVSGGLDSIALLHIVAELRQHLRCTPIVVHVNHQLRGIASDDDERFVVAQADACGLLCVHERVDVMRYAHDHGNGVEDAARACRYNVFERTAIDYRAQLVLTAHTQDDQAETFLLHLARGSGLHGLSAMPPSRMLPNGVVLARPMLEVRRADLEELARMAGWTWREDASNDDVTFLRNAVRKHVMPVLREHLGPTISTSIATSTELLRDSRSIVDAVVREHAAVLIHTVGGATLIDASGLASLQLPLQREIVRRAVRPMLGAPPDRMAVERIVRLLDASTGAMASIKHGLVALRERDHLVISVGEVEGGMEPVIIHGDGVYVAGERTLTVETHRASSVTLDADRAVAYIDALSITRPLEWRPWRKGERMRPLGSASPVLVSDLLTNAKVDHRTKDRSTVLADANGIVWLCGHRLSDHVKVQSTTQHVTVCRIS